MGLDIKIKNYDFSFDDFSYFVVIKNYSMSVLTI